jgi:hypothetical protein
MTAQPAIGVKRKRWFVYFDNTLLGMDLSIYEKMVYIALCSHANKDGECFPSVGTIAKEASCSRPKVFEALKVLEERGLISKENRIFEGRGQVSNLYEINDIGAGGPRGNQREDEESSTPSPALTPVPATPSPALTPPVNGGDAHIDVLELYPDNKDLNPPLTPPEGGGEKEEALELEGGGGGPEKPETKAGRERRWHEAIAAEYNRILPELSRAEKVTDSRSRAIRARVRQDIARKELDWWIRYFERVRKFPWLLGDNPSNWLADLDWLLREEPMQKVVEGSFSTLPTRGNRGASGGRTAAAVAEQKKYTNERGEVDARALLRNSRA